MTKLVLFRTGTQLGGYSNSVDEKEIGATVSRTPILQCLVLGEHVVDSFLDPLIRIPEDRNAVKSLFCSAAVFTAAETTFLNDSPCSTMPSSSQWESIRPIRSTLGISEEGSSLRLTSEQNFTIPNLDWSHMSSIHIYGTSGTQKLNKSRAVVEFETRVRTRTVFILE